MENLSLMPIKPEWSFSDKTIKHTSYITHGIYTYPAKFIPQLASRLINEYSQKNDIVIDPFMGSGTTVVEAIVNSRIGIGVDVNEIAVLLAKVKSTPVDYKLLMREYSNLISNLYFKLGLGFKNELKEATSRINLNRRVNYWFKAHTKNSLMIILNSIIKIKNKDIKDIFLIAFAQILKSCSIWSQRSIKPMRDLHKKEIDPLYKFEWQVKSTLKKYREFHDTIEQNVIDNILKYRIVKNADARSLPCESKKGKLILTSPPYVTSYEYADLHQLPSLWFKYLDELSVFRKKFIGSAYRKRDKIDLKSKVANRIVSAFGQCKKAQEVAVYFADMLESFIEMKRVLKKRGKAIIVIGNTKLQGVEILNAEVFREQLENIGFSTYDIIRREIPSKMLPSTRDPKTGKFTTVLNRKKTLVYPTEYILIMEKM